MISILIQIKYCISMKKHKEKQDIDKNNDLKKEKKKHSLLILVACYSSDQLSLVI